MQDDWHIRIEKRYLNQPAGSSARDQERELAAGKSTPRRLVERLLDVRSDDRNWRKGAEGEERVAAVLARTLGDRWSVVHDLTVGTKGANLDHLLIGPAGVFMLNTKNLTGRLKVDGRGVYQNGHRTGFVPSAMREARIVEDRLSAVVERTVRAWSVLVITGSCEVQVKRRPTDFALVTLRQLPGWSRNLPEGTLTAGQVLQLERAARDPDTWFPPKRRPRPTTASSEPPPSPPGPPAAGVGGDDGQPAVTVHRWTRYGKERLYANAADGTRLGFIDVPTGTVHLEVPDPSGQVTASLHVAHRSVTRRPTP
jgi:hypothetical protein